MNTGLLKHFFQLIIGFSFFFPSISAAEQIEPINSVPDISKEIPKGDVLPVPPAPQEPIKTGGTQPWTLNADKLISLDDGVVVEAYGQVLLQRGEDYLKADFARYYTSTDWVFVKGNVEAKMGRDIINSAEADFDLKSKKGWLKDGTIFVAGPHLYIKGKNIDKLHGDRYIFRNARVTMCDAETPAWSVDSALAEVEIDGYATLTHTRVNVKDVPVIPSPYMILPAKKGRQSGFLMPSVGTNSNLGGFVTVPYFWAIDKSRDLTIYGTYMGKVGFMPSLEYRSYTRPGEKNYLALDFLHDTNTFTNDKDDPVNTTDGKIVNSENRFWIRGMGEGYVDDSNWRYRYVVDYTSDQNFLRQFRYLPNGFNYSQGTLADMFGRDIKEADQNRVSEGFLFRDWDYGMLALGFRYEELTYLGHGNESHNTDTTVQRIPLNTYLYKNRFINALPLELQADVSATYEYRRKGIRGLRTELHPEVTIPLALPGFSVLVNGGVRQTFYNANSVELIDSDKSTRGSDNHDRTIGEFSVEAFSQASRSWDLSYRALPAIEENLGQSAITGLLHRIQPRIQYGIVPDVDQSENPYFEDDDRIKPSHVAKISLVNSLTQKESFVVKNNEGFTQNISYSTPFRWEVSTGYDINEANRTKYTDIYENKPVLDITSFLEFRFNRYLSVSNKMYISPYGDGITRNDSGISITPFEWLNWGITYSSRNEFYNYRTEMKRDNASDIHFTGEQELLTNSITVRPFSSLSLTYITQEDLKNETNLKHEVQLGYFHQCFAVIGQYIHKDNSDTFRVMLTFPGFSL